jgi:hypothetical protein
MITAPVFAADGADHLRVLDEVGACLGENCDLRDSTMQVEHISRPLELDAHA